jgi:uncharacterized membrane protein
MQRIWYAEQFLEKMPNLKLKFSVNHWNDMNKHEVMKLLVFFLSLFTRKQIIITYFWSCFTKFSADLPYRVYLKLVRQFGQLLVNTCINDTYLDFEIFLSTINNNNNDTFVSYD